MKTKRTINLQNEIKNLILRLGWSQKQLAHVIYVATHECDNQDEMMRYEATISKQLKRPTTNPEVLEVILNTISKHDDFHKLDIIRPAYYKTGVLSTSMELGMKDISKLVDKLVLDDDL